MGVAAPPSVHNKTLFIGHRTWAVFPTNVSMVAHAHGIPQKEKSLRPEVDNFAVQLFQETP